MRWDLEILKRRAEQRIQVNLALDVDHKKAITNLLWWALLLEQRISRGEPLGDVTIKIAEAVRELELRGFFKPNHRQPITTTEVFKRIRAEIEKDIRSETA